MRGWSSLLVLALSVLPLAAAAGEIGINVYGLSYHFERDRAEALGVDNEVNPGLGLRYRGRYSERVDWFLDGGAYRDSGRNTAMYAGGGALWKATPALGLGLGVAVFDSNTYNRGRAFIAPLPVLSYDLGKVSLNLTYMPKLSDFNDINTLGLWVTFWPRRW